MIKLNQHTPFNAIFIKDKISMKEIWWQTLLPEITIVMTTEKFEIKDKKKKMLF